MKLSVPFYNSTWQAAASGLWLPKLIIENFKSVVTIYAKHWFFFFFENNLKSEGYFTFLISQFI